MDDKRVVPDGTLLDAIQHGVQRHIEAGHKQNRRFQLAFQQFLNLCRISLNPDLTREKADEMLVQHLLGFVQTPNPKVLAVRGRLYLSISELIRLT